MASLSGSCLSCPLCYRVSATLITFYLWHMVAAPCLQRRRCFWFGHKIKMEASVSSCLWFLSWQKKDPAQFLQVHGRAYKIHLDPAVALAAESPINMWGKNTHITNTLHHTHTHTHQQMHKRLVGACWLFTLISFFNTFILSFCSKDAMAGRCQQHDWQVRCQGSPGLYPHLHTSTAQHIVS